MSLECVPIWPVPKPRDTLAKNEAERMARRIRQHWAHVGYEVYTWITPIRWEDTEGKSHSVGLFAVRSDMRGGRPQRRIKEQDIGQHLKSPVEIRE